LIYISNNYYVHYEQKLHLPNFELMDTLLGAGASCNTFYNFREYSCNGTCCTLHKASYNLILKGAGLFKQYLSYVTLYIY